MTVIETCSIHLIVMNSPAILASNLMIEMEKKKMTNRKIIVATIVQIKLYLYEWPTFEYFCVFCILFLNF